MKLVACIFFVLVVSCGRNGVFGHGSTMGIAYKGKFRVFTLQGGKQLYNFSSIRGFRNFEIPRYGTLWNIEQRSVVGKDRNSLVNKIFITGISPANGKVVWEKYIQGGKLIAYSEMDSLILVATDSQIVVINRKQKNSKLYTSPGKLSFVIFHDKYITASSDSTLTAFSLQKFPQPVLIKKLRSAIPLFDNGSSILIGFKRQKVLYGFRRDEYVPALIDMKGNILWKQKNVHLRYVSQYPSVCVRDTNFIIKGMNVFILSQHNGSLVWALDTAVKYGFFSEKRYFYVIYPLTDVIKKYDYSGVLVNKSRDEKNFPVTDIFPHDNILLSSNKFFYLQDTGFVFIGALNTQNPDYIMKNGDYIAALTKDNNIALLSIKRKRVLWISQLM